MIAFENPEPAPPWAKKALAKLDTHKVKQSWIPVSSTEALGCGHYGCVYELPDPEVVLKFSSDPTEVAFIKKAMEIGEWPEGIVAYYAVGEIEMTYRSRPIYAIWRESAFQVGLPSFFGRTRGYEEQALNKFGLRLLQFKDSAALVKQMLDRKSEKGRAELLDRASDFEQWAWDNIALEDAEGVPVQPGSALWRKYSRIKAQRGPRRLAAALRACKIIAQMMGSEYQSDLVGEALEFYLDKGILLADVHGNNVGQVQREGYAPWVITDPGHAVDLSF